MVRRKYVVDEKQKWLEEERARAERYRDAERAAQRAKQAKTHEAIKKWAAELAKPSREAVKAELDRRAHAAAAKAKASTVSAAEIRARKEELAKLREEAEARAANDEKANADAKMSAAAGRHFTFERGQSCATCIGIGGAVHDAEVEALGGRLRAQRGQVRGRQHWQRAARREALTSVRSAGVFRDRLEELREKRAAEATTPTAKLATPKYIQPARKLHEVAGASSSLHATHRPPPVAVPSSHEDDEHPSATSADRDADRQEESGAPSHERSRSGAHYVRGAERPSSAGTRLQRRAEYDVLAAGGRAARPSTAKRPSSASAAEHSHDDYEGAGHPLLEPTSPPREPLSPEQGELLTKLRQAAEAASALSLRAKLTPYRRLLSEYPPPPPPPPPPPLPLPPQAPDAPDPRAEYHAPRPQGPPSADTDRDAGPHRGPYATTAFAPWVMCLDMPLQAGIAPFRAGRSAPRLGDPPAATAMERLVRQRDRKHLAPDHREGCAQTWSSTPSRVPFGPRMVTKVW